MKGIITGEAGYGMNMRTQQSHEFMPNGSMDFPVSDRETAFGYNEWGALVMDESRGITDISYVRFGNPLRISYANGAYTENVYSATGEKLRMTHGTTLGAATAGIELYCDMDFAETAGQDAMAAVASATSVTEYHGNVIYKDGKVDMVLFPGGYATVNGTAVTFHYYTQDYLGNNRAVINGSTGAIEQTTAYYPYGGVIADLGNPMGGQPYRFVGKELIRANGLNEYDFGATQYYPTVPGITRPDQHCENYHWMSPYSYCANNPVNAIDPTGMDIWEVDDTGHLYWRHKVSVLFDSSFAKPSPKVTSYARRRTRSVLATLGTSYARGRTRSVLATLHLAMATACIRSGKCQNRIPRMKIMHYAL